MLLRIICHLGPNEQICRVHIVSQFSLEPVCTCPTLISIPGIMGNSNVTFYKQRSSKWSDSCVKDVQSVCLLLLHTNFVTDKYTKHLRNEERN